MHVVAHDEGNAPNPYRSVFRACGDETPVWTEVAEQHGVGGRSAGIPAKPERPAVLQGKHKQLLLAQILPCVGFHRIDERHIPRADESVVSCGKEQIVHGIVLQLAYKPLVETAAAHTPEPRERGLCGDCDGCDVPEKDPAVFAGAHQNGVVGVDHQIGDFSAVTANGLTGC